MGKVFHQVELNESGGKCTGLLPLKDLEEDAEGFDLLTCHFRRIPFAVITSSLLLAAVIEKHLKNDESSLSKAILKNFYVNIYLYYTGRLQSQSGRWAVGHSDTFHRGVLDLIIRLTKVTAREVEVTASNFPRIYNLVTTWAHSSQLTHDYRKATWLK